MVLTFFTFSGGSEIDASGTPFDILFWLYSTFPGDPPTSTFWPFFYIFRKSGKTPVTLGSSGYGVTLPDNPYALYAFYLQYHFDLHFRMHLCPDGIATVHSWVCNQGPQNDIFNMLLTFSGDPKSTPPRPNLTFCFDCIRHFPGTLPNLHFDIFWLFL